MNKRIMILTGSMVDCQNHASLDAVVGLRYLSCFLVNYLSIAFMVISYHEGLCCKCQINTNILRFLSIFCECYNKWDWLT